MFTHADDHHIIDSEKFDLEEDGEIARDHEADNLAIQNFLGEHPYLDISMNRAVCATIYKNLKNKGSGMMTFTPVELIGLTSISKTLDNGKSYDENLISAILSIKIFDELGLIRCRFQRNTLLIKLYLGKKVELQKSTLYNSICC